MENGYQSTSSGKPLELNGDTLTISDVYEVAYNNKTISIDAFNTLYQFLATIRGPMGEPLKNRDGEITSHLTGLFYRNINLLNANIKPIFIFDGKPPELKKKEIKRRK